MPFIEVVVHAGSVESGKAEVPSFELSASNTLPKLGEYVRLTAVVEGNATEFAYSWYLNEQPLTASNFLNNPSILLNLNELGHNIVRVQVSDMRGGVGSRNLVISVGNKDITNQSLVTEQFAPDKTLYKVHESSWKNPPLLTIICPYQETYTTAFSQVVLTVLPSF